MYRAAKNSMLLLAVLVVAGCAGTEADPLNSDYVDGWIASIVGASIVSDTEPSPDTVECSNCGGTGKLPGDGVIQPDCPVCDGTGRTTDDVVDPSYFHIDCPNCSKPLRFKTEQRDKGYRGRCDSCSHVFSLDDDCGPDGGT